MFARSTRLRSRVLAMAVAAPALALAAALIFWALAPTAPLRAAAEPRDPVARVQVVLKQVYVASDRDTIGGGEMRLEMQLFRCAEGGGACLGQQGLGPALAYSSKDFSASSDQTVTLDETLPRAADTVYGEYEASEDGGYPVYDGERYALVFGMTEDDLSGFDRMGSMRHALFVENDWGVGTHAMWSQLPDENRRGDYQLVFEVRRVSLPDLRPKAIRVVDAADSMEDIVCLDVENVGQQDAGPFQMTLRADTSVQRNGIASMAELPVGETRETCIRTNLPTSGLHQLSLTIDEARAVPEMGELNNRIEETLDRTPLGGVRPPVGQGVLSTDPDADSSPQPPPAATPTPTPLPLPTPTPTPLPTPTPTPNPAQADLTVSAIRVRGKVPDGNDDCKDGKNDVTVVVRNGGTANAGAFAVRLVIDGDLGDAEEESVSGLDAGQEREVDFDDVRLKKGDRTLTATADTKAAVAESNEANNGRTVTATCKDD